jgi:VWFA-related protein
MPPLRSFAAAALLVAAQQQPVFRSGVELVTIDVTVMDRKGDPLEGLGPDRFEVTVDGAPRRVVWAEFVRHRAAPLVAVAPTDHFTTNEGAEPGRIVLIAVDQTHIRRVEGLAALRAASNFIDALDPADRIAAAPINHGGAIQFTTEHAVVKRQLQRLTGEAQGMPVHYKIGLSEALAIADGSRTRLDQVVLRECGEPLGRYENLRRLAEGEGLKDPCPVQVEQEGRALAQQARTESRISLEALARLIARLAEIEGPKTLVLLSEGLVAEPQLIDLTSLGAAAQAARVTLHVLQLDVPILEASTDTVSPSLYPDMQLKADGLARLAGSARGGLFRLIGDDPYPFRRIMKELSSHYLVAFEPADGDRDGRTHRIGVRVRADGAMVRARPAFTIPAAPRTVPPDAELVGLLRDPRIVTDLPLRVAGYAFRDSDGERLHVLVSAEVEQARGSGPEPTAGFVLVDSRGVIAASGGGTTEGGRYWHSATLAPGRYMLKAAAIDAGGRRGSVERQLDARLSPAGPLQMSDLMLAEPPLDPSAPLRPLVVRVAGQRLVAYLEAYGPAPSGPATATVRVDITRSDVPSPVASIPAPVTVSPSGRWVISADLPIRDLPTGSYLASMHLSLPGVPPQHLTRRFVVTR